MTSLKAWLVPLLIIAVLSGLMGHLTRPIIMKDLYPIMQERMENYRQYMSDQQYAETKARMEQSYKEAIANHYKWYYPLFSLGVPFLFFLIIGGLVNWSEIPCSVVRPASGISLM